VAVSCAVLALTGPAWVAPTVTIAGLAAGSYVLGLCQKATGSSGAPEVALCASAWGSCYAIVALACLPGVPRPVRVVVVVLLIAPMFLFLAF
jgi:hypothetical protein